MLFIPFACLRWSSIHYAHNFQRIPASDSHFALDHHHDAVLVWYGLPSYRFISLHWEHCFLKLIKTKRCSYGFIILTCYRPRVEIVFKTNSTKLHVIDRVMELSLSWFMPSLELNVTFSFLSLLKLDSKFKKKQNLHSFTHKVAS